MTDQTVMDFLFTSSEWLRTTIQHLRLCTMTHNHATWANHIERQSLVWLMTKPIYRSFKVPFLFSWITFTQEQGYLSDGLCWFPGSVGGLNEVQVSLQRIFHTHSDTDQEFNITRRFPSYDAITLRDLHHELSQYFNEKMTCTIMGDCINRSGLCDTALCVQKASA